MWPDLAMKRVKIAELKNQLSKHLRAVERGASFEVTDRDRPVARIVPIGPPGPEITVIPASRPFQLLRSKRYPPTRLRRSSLALLLEERGKR
jgi:prevent-host-death family protein